MRRFTKELKIIFAICLSIFIVVKATRTFFIEYIVTPSAAMAPTILPGDRVLVNLQFNARNMKLGEIIAYEVGGRLYLSRVVGLPGDHLKLLPNGVIERNSIVYNEEGISNYSIFKSLNERLRSDTYSSQTHKLIRSKIGNELAELVFEADRKSWRLVNENLYLSNDQYYVIGDNRFFHPEAQSRGLIKLGQVKGKVFSIF